MTALLFWAAFTVAAVYMQRLIPGVDLLVAGLVVSLQREKWGNTLWLGVVWILLQEGTGTLTFGSSLIRYAVLVMLFYLGRWLLQTTSMVFMILLSVSMAVLHWIIIQLMAELQDLYVNGFLLTREALLQAVLFPAAWLACYKLYDKFVHVKRQA